MTRPPTTRRLALALVSLVFFSGVLAWQLVRLRSGATAPLETLPDLGRVPAFSLTSQSGATVTNASFAGKAYVVDFIFTRCAGQCPPMTAAMASLARKTSDRADLKFLSVSVDPEHDTVEALAAYALRYEADLTRWSFVRGERDVIRRLARDGFKLAVEDASPQDPEPILHSARFVLVDRSGTIRGYYDGLEPAGVARLQTDVTRLLAASAR